MAFCPMYVQEQMAQQTFGEAAMQVTDEQATYQTQRSVEDTQHGLRTSMSSLNVRIPSF